MVATTSNAEVLRLHYLQAMGITSYYPRLQLPGARLSQPCEWLAADSVDAGMKAAALDETEALTSPVPPPAQAAAAIPDPQAKPVRRSTWQDEPSPAIEPPRAAATSQHSRPDPAEALHFQLLLMPVDAELAVLGQIPALARPQLQDRQALLLGNILRWLGRPLPAVVDPRVFKWPLPGLALTNSRKEAGASLMHFLEQACLEQPFRFLLLLGEQAADCLHGQIENERSSQGRPWQLVATHSLDEMLALPQLKREVWQNLLPLHAALRTIPLASSR